MRVYYCHLLVYFVAFVAQIACAQNCSLESPSRGGIKPDDELIYYVGDTVKIPLRIIGLQCGNCAPVCLNCSTLDYTITDGQFRWVTNRSQQNSKILLRFGINCAKLDTMSNDLLRIAVKIIGFNYKFQLDFDNKTPSYIRSEIAIFLNSKGGRITQLTVREGDTLYFKLLTSRSSPGKLSVIQSFRSFDGITYADAKSIVVHWIPSYKDYKRDPIHELRVSLSNGEIINDPDQVLKSIKFRITLSKNRPPLIDRMQSSIIDLDRSGDTYINLADYFIPTYDRRDDEMQFDYFPKDLPCIKLSSINKNELVIKKSLYLNTYPKPSEIVVRARHSNSPYCEDLHLILKNNFEPLSLALENRKFSYYDGDRIDEFIKIEFNEPYHLEMNKIEILGDTAIYDLKKLIHFDDTDSQYLHMYTSKKVEIDDTETDDIQFTVNLEFINDFKKQSHQAISLLLHPRVNGDVARLYFKNQVDSIKIFLDSIKVIGVRIGKVRDQKAKRIDWYSKGISFIAIIVGSYGTAKNSANYGYGIMAGLAMGALFLDLKQLSFFVTKKYQKAKEATDALDKLELDIEKHLVTDIDKMGVSFFEANYRQSDQREHHAFLERYNNIQKSFSAVK